MGRCNGGGGRRHGGGGFQEGQKTGTKAGKTGHGKTSGHDAASTQREVQKRDPRTGQPLNYGPYRNGYFIGKDKAPSSGAERVGLGTDQMEELSTLLTQSSVAPPPQAASDPAAASRSSTGASRPPRQARDGGADGEMSASQRRESERLLAAHEALRASAAHSRLREARTALPAYEARSAVLEAVASRQALVLCGETGCGKSTQVPQYLLEAAIESGVGAACTVLIAQPRRVAAVALAERVAAERGEAVGETVGYSIRHEAVAHGTTTRLLFCTTGVILRRLQEDATLAGVSHVIVDEAHERSADGDFLLMVLRRMLPRRPDLKVILMSATLDAALFEGFFAGASQLHIPGRTFAVTPFFLEDALELTKHAVAGSAPWARRAERGGKGGGKGKGKGGGGSE